MTGISHWKIFYSITHLFWWGPFCHILYCMLLVTMYEPESRNDWSPSERFLVGLSPKVGSIRTNAWWPNHVSHLHGMTFYVNSLLSIGRNREWDVQPTLTNRPSMSTRASLPNTRTQRDHPQCTEMGECQQPTWTRTWRRRNSSSGWRTLFNQACLKPAMSLLTALLLKLAAPRVVAAPLARKRRKERSNGELFRHIIATKENKKRVFVIV